MRRRLLIFASGDAEGGGSGGEKLVERSKHPDSCIRVVGIVSNYKNGGVRKRAERLGIPFHYLPKSRQTAEGYQELVRVTGAEFVALSGWLKLVVGLDPRTTFNIHPGPLPEFGNTFGHHTHEAVLAAFQRRKLTHSAVTMHFVTEEYDQGPPFFVHSVPIHFDDTPETLGKRVNAEEHFWQWRITEMVLLGEISWDGKDPATLTGAMIN